MTQESKNPQSQVDDDDFKIIIRPIETEEDATQCFNIFASSLRSLRPAINLYSKNSLISLLRESYGDQRIKFFLKIILYNAFCLTFFYLNYVKHEKLNHILLKTIFLTPLYYFSFLIVFYLILYIICWVCFEGYIFLSKNDDFKNLKKHYINPENPTSSFLVAEIEFEDDDYTRKSLTLTTKQKRKRMVGCCGFELLDEKSMDYNYVCKGAFTKNLGLKMEKTVEIRYFFD